MPTKKASGIGEAAQLARDLVEAAEPIDAEEFASAVAGQRAIPVDTLAALREAVPAVLRARALMSRDVAVIVSGSEVTEADIRLTP